MGNFCRFLGGRGSACGVKGGKREAGGRRRGAKLPSETVAEQSPASEPAWRRAVLSIREHVFVVRRGIHVATGLVGIWPWSVRRGQAGGRVMPDAEMSQGP
jgi:hypothetical protein